MPTLDTCLRSGLAGMWLAYASAAVAQPAAPITPPAQAQTQTEIQAPQTRPRWPISNLLFTSFRGSGDGLHLSFSEDDGRTWQDMGKVFLKPALGSGLMRDPHLTRGPDGVFRLVWTTGWKDKGIGYAASTDLVNWSQQTYLPFFEGVDGTHNAWAPETFYDEATGQYVITWSSDIDGRFAEARSDERMNNRTYYVTTKDFETFSAPKLLIDPGFDHIDTTLIKDGERYIAVFKEGDRQASQQWGAIRWAVADTVLGPYRLMPNPLVSGQRAEGPTLRTQDGKTRLYVDYYADGRYGVFETTDWVNWADVSAEVTVAKGQRHGTVLSAPAWLVREMETAKPSGTPVTVVPAPPAALDGFTADPSIRVFGDTYYIYPTSDKPNWQTTDFSVWSSKNLVDWKREAMILDVANDLGWGKIQAWAPDAIERDGTYYFYFCAEGNIGVATSKSPTGPFVDALGKPLLAKGTGIETNTIDPYPFIDEDGQAYLYYGNGRLGNVVKLKRDMITVDGPVMTIELKDHREGPVVFKRNGQYYFMWSIDDARSPNYRVGWGVAESPLGPVVTPDKDFIVLQRNGPAVGTAHHSVVNVPGTDRWYVAYHRHALPEGGGYQRQTVLARMEFNPDGSIRPMDPMVVPFKPGDVGEPIVNGRGRIAP
ncbi:family 43 glycosylhydrolase [Asticcacaulis tiandongensis]|uniref:family 43 glycosylhydrolase n=1 Tax=Asticcacaulis tiandongensis TaxID=2565365 RepID=UPI001FE9426C|nr:family 43 glycosylhydrolase [Asticcacaulis tiandongensis]